MPYRSSSPESLDHAQLVIDALGIPSTTVDISSAVDALAARDRRRSVEPGRLGNIMARTRMITLFDLSAAHRALPLGTGNKTERLFGYFTWHADDSPRSIRSATSSRPRSGPLPGISAFPTSSSPSRPAPT